MIAPRGLTTIRLAALVAVLAAALPGTALGSQLIDRNASGVKLAVNAGGQALLTYRAGGELTHVLVWGAVDARQPSPSRPQVEFKVDYSGGWRSFHKLVWQGFRNACRPYNGPALAWKVTACTAPDGTFWAVQSWQRPLPDLGMTPWRKEQTAWELRVSHWTGDNVASLQVYQDWVYGRFAQLFGRMTYLGQPVHGFRTTSSGVPKDAYGRNLYLDTLNSVYGQGWRRENSFVAHNPDGTFCYGFYPFKVAGYDHPASMAASTVRGPGTGAQYRITVIGPGVSPDIIWQDNGLHGYDANNPADVQLEQQMNGVLDSVMAGDKSCRRY